MLNRFSQMKIYIGSDHVPILFIPIGRSRILDRIGTKSSIRDLQSESGRGLVEILIRI